ncbi:MAG: HD domain-containing protein [Clostridiales bacterium]|nr:HD domain-containing protein [Clostridiales bacterium]
MDRERIQKQLQFLIEADKMKTILRQTMLTDKSRRENDAEHSWHFALTAMVLFEYAHSPEVDQLRVLRMALVHDLVEIYAGDTFLYDDKANEDKEERERAAADRLFGMLPQDQGAEYRALWEEFDAAQTADAVYAGAIDRIQPLLNNYMVQGYTWKKGNVHSGQVLERMQPIKKGIPEVWPVIEFIIEDSVKKGYLQK